MPIVDSLWVLVGLSHTLCAIVCAKHSSILGDLLLTDKRHMRSSHHTNDDEYLYRPWETRFPSECCPSVTQGIAPLGGLSRDGALLELYRDSNTIQKFYETTCAHGVRGRPCNFINHSQLESRCEQKYSYTYAIVKDFNVTEPYRIDYMKIKSGCSCSIKGFSRQQLLNEFPPELIENKK